MDLLHQKFSGDTTFVNVVAEIVKYVYLTEVLVEKY